MSTRPTVLLVDGDIGVLAQRRALLSADFDVEVCISAEFAVHRARQRSFDVICTTLEMPASGMNGVEMLGQIAEFDPFTQHMLVALAQEPLFRALAEEKPGRIRVLIEPYEPQDFVAATDSLAQLSLANRAA